MSEWIPVLTHPLGLTGFALFLVFLYLTKRTRKRQQPTWLQMVFGSMAIVTLLGGIILAYVQSTVPEKKGPWVIQQTGGNTSPAISDVKGTLELNIGSPDIPPKPTLPEDIQANVDQRNTQSAFKELAQPPAKTENPAHPNRAIQQETQGKSSPVVTNVQGDVTITVTDP